MQQRARLSIVIPAYNEGGILDNTIKMVHSTISKLNEKFELIIADDGSEDFTHAIAEKWSKKHPEIELVSNAINMGRGAALTKSFYKASGDYILYIDADLAIELSLLEKIISRLKSGADVVIGSKHMPGAEVNYPLMRKICSKGYSILTQFLLNSNIKDYQCGCKGFKKVVIENILPFMRNTAWTWDTEIIIKSQWAGYKVEEIPAKVKDVYGRESKVHLIRDIRKMGFALLKLWLEKLWIKKRLEKFNKLL